MVGLIIFLAILTPCLIGLFQGITISLSNKPQKPTAETQKIQTKPIKRVLSEDEKNSLCAELDRLKLQLDILCQIEQTQNIDINKSCDENELKKFLSTQKNISTILSKIDKIEEKLKC